jgi:CheY-like chemotaxis protein
VAGSERGQRGADPGEGGERPGIERPGFEPEGGGTALASSRQHEVAAETHLPAIEPVPPAAPSVEKVMPTGKGQWVLFVDDETSIVRLATRILERLGYRVTACLRPEDALEAVRAAPGKFDLLISDWMMPHMTGLDLALAVQKLRPGLPVLLSTGNMAPLDQDVIARAGIREVLQKPYTLQLLSLALERALTPELT